MSYWTLEGLSPALFGGTSLRDRAHTARSSLALAFRTTVTRRTLADLDDHALEDVGLTRADALIEARRAPWDIEPPRRQYRPTWQPNPGPAAMPQPVGTWLRQAWRRHQSRRAITQLDAHMLKDIGITYSQAELEANKGFWRM
jgi:uncharacterized protein YjiS (DUF1127 family)